MTGSPFPVTQFGGLNLNAEADEVPATQAIDLNNIDLDARGAIRTRDGVAAFATVAGSPQLIQVFSWSANAQLFVASSSTVYAVASDGSALANVAAANYSNGVGIGTGAAGPYFYFGGTNAGQIRRWDGAAFSAPAGMPNARIVALQSPDNRLVAANTSTATKSRVQFSDPGAPETWGANNYVDLYPNDGEAITEAVSWGDQLFVFKRNRFFVFYGNSTDADGEPVFNYRMVDAGIGAHDNGTGAKRVATVGPDGVYFMHRSGIYRTTGGAPERISAGLDPLFRGQPIPFAASLATMTTGNPNAIAAVGDKLFCNVTDGTAQKMLVRYFSTGEWTVWSPSYLGGIAAFTKASNRAPRLFTIGVVDGRVYELTPGQTTDDGNAIASLYRSGFYTAGNSPDQEVKIRETILDGIGTPSVSVSRDFGAVPTTGGGAKTAVTLGTSPAIAQGRHRVAQRGRRFSTQIEATSGAWRVESLVHHVTGVRDPGLKTT